uniref:Uncharacterized protein n=1 Tax=Anguilla anguilla TaxID=7936 RepID=A0A0E9RQ15_ANGAN
MYTVLELFSLFILKLWQTFCPLDRGVQSLSWKVIMCLSSD